MIILLDHVQRRFPVIPLDIGILHEEPHLIRGEKCAQRFLEPLLLSTKAELYRRERASRDACWAPFMSSIAA
jgi:hypothetical protein